MSVITRTVAVNAAFLQEIKEDNRLVRDFLQQALDLLSVPRRVPARRIVNKLWQVRDQLAMHFALEDAYGYFEDAIVEADETLTLSVASSQPGQKCSTTLF